MATNHRIKRAFPALWWAKHSFGEGVRTVPWTEQMILKGKEVSEQSLVPVSYKETGRSRLSQRQPEWVIAHWHGEKEGDCARPLPGAKRGREPHTCSWAAIPACAKPAHWGLTSESPRSRSCQPVGRLQKVFYLHSPPSPLLWLLGLLQQLVLASKEFPKLKKQVILHCVIHRTSPKRVH